MPTGTVSLIRVESRPTAVVAETTTWEHFPSVWREGLNEVYGLMRGRPDLATGEGSEMWQNVMLYRDDRPSVEVGVLVARSFASAGRVVPSELPGGEVATATHRGDYARLAETHAAIRAHVAAQGRRLAGPRWEIYGHWRENPAELETEVSWLLADTNTPA